MTAHTHTMSSPATLTLGDRAGARTGDQHSAWRGVSPRGVNGRDVADAHVTSTRLRITSRGRAVLAGIILVPLLVAALLWGASAAFASSDGGSSSVSTPAHTHEYVTVGHGGTLWQIVAEFPRVQDPRDSVLEIMALNNLESSALEPGQQLALPASLTQGD